MPLHGIDESSYFIEVALCVDLVIDECWHEVIAMTEILDGLMIWTDFLKWDVEEGGWLGIISKFLHLRKAIDARMGTYFQRFFGSRPCVSGGEFEGADNVRMLEHKYVRVHGDLLAGNDFGLTEQIACEVEGMDVEIEQGIAFWIGSCEVM